MDPTATPRPGSPGAPLWDPEAIPAATVIVVRDSSAGPEVLLLRRDPDLSFAGGMWVFPGGRIDPVDAGGDGDLEVAARRAAAREAAEEAGLAVDPAELRRWSHWTPPPVTPKRFTTAFFVTRHPNGSDEVVVDDREIREHRWALPTDVLEGRDRGEVALTPPTFITLHQLRSHCDVAAILDAAEPEDGPEHFATRIAVEGDAVIALYHGDAGYESGDPTAMGPRHRLEMGAVWTYERSS